MRRSFSKMQGAGNDFVVLDQRGQAALSAAQIGRLTDRHFGVGCDQLLTIEPARTAAAQFGYSIWNQDGSAAGQCGNGARCVAAWARRAALVSEDQFVMDSPAGPLRVNCAAESIEIAMGQPRFAAEDIPYRGDPASATVSYAGREWPLGMLSMGNPHVLLEVDDVAQAPVAALGAQLQADPRFPDSCNVGFVQRVDRHTLRLRVFERGVGETLACGSGACAAAVWQIRRGRVESALQVHLPGGCLQIDWPGAGAEVLMRGPATFVFEGEIEL